MRAGEARALGKAFELERHTHAITRRIGDVSEALDHAEGKHDRRPGAEGHASMRLTVWRVVIARSATIASGSRRRRRAARRSAPRPMRARRTASGGIIIERDMLCVYDVNPIYRYIHITRSRNRVQQLLSRSERSSAPSRAGMMTTSRPVPPAFSPL
jgi:hypothetical protein